MGGKLACNNPQQIKNTLNFEEAFKKVKDDHAPFCPIFTIH